jgi:hypothetical protein
MQTISIIEIFIILTAVAIAWDIYKIYSFHLSHYQQGISLCSGTSPYPGRVEFPSNYKMIYKSEDILYKFTSPTIMVFRYNYESGNLKNLILIKGIGILKNGEINLTTRMGLTSPLSICLLLIVNILLLGRSPDPQEILFTVFSVFLVILYFLYCRKAAHILPRIVADKIDESLLH